MDNSVKRMAAAILLVLIGVLFGCQGGIVDTARTDQQKEKVQSGQEATNANRHILLHLQKDGFGIQLLGQQTVESSLPKKRAGRVPGAWYFEAKSDAGTVQYQGFFDDPTILRGEFADPSDPSKIERVLIQLEQQGAVDFEVRLPLIGAKQVDFFVPKDGTMGVGAASFEKERFAQVGSLSLGAPNAHSVQAPSFEVESLQQFGPSGNRIDIAILGDGYRAQDQEKLTDDANAVLGSLMNLVPFNTYRQYFNVSLVHVVSEQDGADGGALCPYGPPGRTGCYRNTALGATFWCGGIDRLLCIDTNAVINVASTHVPEYDTIVVIVNDTMYGGAGYTGIATLSMDVSAPSILQHELGHSFGHLADEYDYGGSSVCYGDCPEPNVTTVTDRALVKWSAWILDTTPVPTPETSLYDSVIGVFQGARYVYSGVYRPKNRCLMKELGIDFCSVCSEALVLSINGSVNLIDEATPASPVLILENEPMELSATHPTQDPETLVTQWLVDGRVHDDASGFSHTFSGGELGAGMHSVTLEVSDVTELVRNDPSSLQRDQFTWTVQVNGFCIIDGGRYLDGERNPKNSAQVCLVRLSTTRWCYQVFLPQISGGDATSGEIHESFDGPLAYSSVSCVGGTYDGDWTIWFDDDGCQGWGSGRQVELGNGQQSIGLERGSYGLRRKFGDIGGKKLTVSHDYDGNGWYEILTNVSTLALVKFTGPVSGTLADIPLPAGATEIVFKVGQTDGGFHRLILSDLLIR